MKSLLFLFSVVLLSCSSSDSGSSTSPSSVAEGLPTGAIKEQFADAPSLIGFTVKDASGNISQSGLVEDGKRIGNWTEYSPNGIVKSVVSYVNGKKEGLALEINNSGQLEKQMMYHSDQLHGIYKEYKYTTLKEERNYQNGKLEGIVKVYYDNGKIMEEGAYQNGTRHGVSKWYDQDGNVTIEYEYDNGKLIKK
ncbi:MAG: toxin-antitoxin system YwqK family antitoxin [Cyclobacteriaceae bacterium]|nr:toxin-antitoxin system YwqK family antitoxin [Cyclobacteriaceae bacterium]